MARVHTLAALTSAVTTSTAMLAGGFPTPEITACTLGFVATLWINPDLDLNRSFPRHQPEEWLPWLLWWPYAHIVSPRSPLAHFPLIGTALRVLYILIPMLFVMQLLGMQESIKPLLGWFLYGMALSDTIHCLLDVIATSWKCVRRELRRVI